MRALVRRAKSDKSVVRDRLYTGAGRDRLTDDAEPLLNEL